MSKILSPHEILTPGEVKELVNWFGQHAVDYPWGRMPTPYRVWISEIMLQQTVVTAAVDHFTRWMKLFPDIPTLAGASEQLVLKAWEGLGYYSRARNIRKGALYIMEHHEGSLPSTYEELIKIPGIGDYTARAVLSMAFEKPFPVLDANVRRIGQRLMGKRDWGTPDDKLLLNRLVSLIPHDNPGIFNCALMQLGQLICRVRSPGCDRCPLRRNCLTCLEGLQSEIPAPKRRVVKEKSSTLFLLVSQGRILLTRRTAGIGRGLWFLPSVPESEERDVLDQLAPLIRRKEILSQEIHLYTTWKETLHPIRLDLKSDSDIPLSCLTASPDDEIQWVPLNQAESYPSPSVYRTIMNKISRDDRV